MTTKTTTAKKILAKATTKAGFKGDLANALAKKKIDGDGNALPVELTPAQKAQAAKDASAKPGASMHKQVQTSALVESPNNFRKDFGDLKALAASMKSVGVLQPLIVRPVGKKLEVVFGHRRLRAAKLAGLKVVPCDVREISDVMADEMRLVENVQREDISAIDEAEGFARLRDVHHYSVDQIAARCGKSKGSVYARLKLLSLCAEARKEVREGKIDASLAVPLARIGDQKVQADALSRVRGMSIRDALNFLHNEHSRSLKGAPFDQSDAQLTPGSGPCTKCPKKTGATPGLFDDLAGRGFDTCTDVPCFKAKVRATWATKSAQAKRDGVKVISVEEGNRMFRAGTSLGFGSPYIDVKDPMPGDPKKKSVEFHLSKLKDADKLERVVAPDAKLNRRTLVKREEVVAALAKVHNWAKEEAAYHPSTPEEADARREESEVRRAVLAKVLADVAQKVPLLERSHLRLIALGFVDSSSEVLRRLDVDAKDAHTFLSDGATEQHLASLIYEAALFEFVGDSWSGYSDEFLALAKREKVDVKALEKGFKDERAKVREEKPPEAAA